MKIFSVSQIRAADQYTISNEPISSINLMERAARACYKWFHAHVARQNSIAIYCGKGNNGGDGLALARMLMLSGYKSVTSIVVEHSNTSTTDFNINLKRLQDMGVAVKKIEKGNHLNVEYADVIVDAMLGSGLNKPLHGLLADVVLALNANSGFKIAIDIPTGLFAGSNAQNNHNFIFKADNTLTFQFPKTSFLFEEFGPYAGQFHVLDINLSKEFINKTASNDYFIDQEIINTILPERHKFDHKGTFGHALLIAGSKGKMGAGILASRAALKTGCGLVTAYVPACGLNPLQAANPEVMVVTDRGEAELENITFTTQPSAVGIGPGIGTSAQTEKAFFDFVSKQSQPLVIDADGINLLAKSGKLNVLPKGSILTPHLGELDRLLGEIKRGEAVYDAAKRFAQNHEQVLLVKGAHTGVYTPSGAIYFNSTGTNGLATAGSGDVLTGMITGFLAQGIDPVQAAICGVYFHGLAAERAAMEKGDAALTAIDVLSHIKIQF